MNVELFEKNKLKGKIYLDKKESIMLSIPYENGWIVKVNDKVINYNMSISILLMEIGYMILIFHILWIKMGILIILSLY